MRIAVLGLGRIGRVHATNLSRIDDVDLIVFDPDDSRADDFADVASVADSARDAFDRADGVVLATPTALHATQIGDAADAGCAVFAEKPISLDLAASQDVVARLDALDVPLQVGFQRRFDPGFTEIRRMIVDGSLGAIYLIRTACHDHVPPHESYLDTSGSIFKDMHTHDFDAIAWLTGRRIESVHARGSVLVDEMFARHNDVDTCALTLSLEGGALAVVTGARSDALGYDHRIEVFGSHDSVSAGLNQRTPLRSIDPEQSAPSTPYVGFADRFADAYRAEIEAFTELVAGRGTNRCPGATAIDALRVAIAADESLATGAAVEVRSS